MLLMTSPEKILVSPHRENLRFSVKKYDKGCIDQGLDWLVKLAKQMGVLTPKTLIFCNTMTEVASVVNWLQFKLGKYSYHPVDSTKKEDLIFGIYHSMSWKANKEMMMKSLSSDGLKRIVIATTALSMGVNFPDIRYILNWGPARSLLDQHQEAGRAGRDGEQSHIIITYYGQQLAQCEDDVKSFVKSTECLRVAAYLPFDCNIKPLDVLHKCCSNCALNCNCGDCESYLHEQNTAATCDLPSSTRHVSEADKKCVREAFVELRDSIPKTCSVLGETCSHTFSLELIDSIVEHCDKIFSIEDINIFLPIFSMQHGIKILEVLDEIFEDIPQLENVKYACEQGNEKQGKTVPLDLVIETELEESSIYEEQLLSLTDCLNISDSDSNDSEGEE